MMTGSYRQLHASRSAKQGEQLSDSSDSFYVPESPPQVPDEPLDDLDPFGIGPAKSADPLGSDQSPF